MLTFTAFRAYLTQALSFNAKDPHLVLLSHSPDQIIVLNMKLFQLEGQ